MAPAIEAGIPDSYLDVCGSYSQRVMSQDDSGRQFCPVQLSKDQVGCTCLKCAWNFRLSADDLEVGRKAFELHRCEDYPRQEQSTEL